MRRISLGFLAAALAVTGLIGLTSISADAGGPGSPVVRISKHKHGPFEEFLGKINIPAGVKKTLYFKVKTDSVGTLAITLNGTGDDSLEDYRIKWFRGAKNVTDKITSKDGLHVNIEAGEVKRYEARIRHFATLESDEAFCFELHAEAPAGSDVSSIGVNAFCA